MLAERAADPQAGVLITLDELLAARIEALRELTATLQHCFREELEVAFVGTGLPSGVRCSSPAG